MPLHALSVRTDRPGLAHPEPVKVREGDAEPNSTDRAALYQAAFNAPSMNAARLRLLVAEFGSLQAALTADTENLARTLQFSAGTSKRFVSNVRSGLPRATAQVRSAVAAGLRVLTWEDAGYPPSLHDDPVGCAPILFVEGHLPPQLAFHSRKVRALAVVGTRRATPGALGFARDIGRALSREGVLVVSGLALGIDGAAHEGALEAIDRSGTGAPAQPQFDWVPGVTPTPRPAGTLAVLGGGHGHLHPAAHRGLARRILNSGGAIVSEWAPDVAPKQYRFLQRNRVISGLARGVLVVEAGVRSGTNSTVTHALDQGRDTYAVPSSPWTASGAGCLAMIREGSEFVFEYSDVLVHFAELVSRDKQVLSDELRQYQSLSAMPGAQPLFGYGQPVAATYAPEGHAATAEIVQRIRDLLAPGVELTLDHLVASTHYSASVLIGTLTALELEGAVEVTPGGRFRSRNPLRERKPPEK